MSFTRSSLPHVQLFFFVFIDSHSSWYRRPMSFHSFFCINFHSIAFNIAICPTVRPTVSYSTPQVVGGRNLERRGRREHTHARTMRLQDQLWYGIADRSITERITNICRPCLLGATFLLALIHSAESVRFFYRYKLFEIRSINFLPSNTVESIYHQFLNLLILYHAFCICS